MGGAGVVAEGNDGDAIFGATLKMLTTLTKVGLSLMHVRACPLLFLINY